MTKRNKTGGVTKLGLSAKAFGRANIRAGDSS